MRNFTLKSLGLAAIIFMASCNDGKEKTETTETTTDSLQQGTTANKTAEGAVRANVNVTITGGDLAGTYEADCRESCCSWGIAGDKVFGNQYSEEGKGPKEVSSVQLVVNDVSGNKTTNNFRLIVSFGELFGADVTTYNINTLKGKSEGSGTADIQYSGDQATVTIKGVSKEGPAIDLKLVCNKVITPSNLGL